MLGFDTKTVPEKEKRKVFVRGGQNILAFHSRPHHCGYSINIKEVIDFDKDAGSERPTSGKTD